MVKVGACPSCMLHPPPLQITAQLCLALRAVDLCHPLPQCWLLQGVTGMKLADLAEAVPHMLGSLLLPKLDLAAFQACCLTSKCLKSLLLDAPEEAWKQAARNSSLVKHHPLFSSLSVYRYLRDQSAIDFSIQTGDMGPHTWTCRHGECVVSHDLSMVAEMVDTCLHITPLGSSAEPLSFEVAPPAPDSSKPNSSRKALEDLLLDTDLLVHGTPTYRLGFRHDDCVVSVQVLYSGWQDVGGPPSWICFLQLYDLRSKTMVTVTLNQVISFRVIEVTPEWAPSAPMFACVLQPRDRMSEDTCQLGLVDASGALTLVNAMTRCDFCWSPDSKMVAGTAMSMETVSCMVQIVRLETCEVFSQSAYGCEWCLFSPCSSMVLACGIQYPAGSVPGPLMAGTLRPAVHSLPDIDLASYAMS